MHTKAAIICDHTVLRLETDMPKGNSYDSTYHYAVYGDKLSCPWCGYERWVNVHTENKGEHEFDDNGFCDCGYKK